MNRLILMNWHHVPVITSFVVGSIAAHQVQSAPYLCIPESCKGSGHAYPSLAYPTAQPLGVLLAGLGSAMLGAVAIPYSLYTLKNIKAPQSTSTCVCGARNPI